MKKLQTILLTGATGFLGSYLLKDLLLKGYKVVILKRSTSNTDRLESLLDQCVSYDVDIQPLELAFEKQRIDVVIHLACHYGRNDDPIHEVIESNLIFGLRILDACLKFNTDTFFNTDTLLQKHLNIYTLSKKQFVEWLKQASDKIQVVNLKLEHIYGPKDDTTKFVPWLLSKLKANVPEVKLTLGEQERDFIYIDDVVSVYLILLGKKNSLPGFSEFDVGTGQLITVREFVERVVFLYQQSIAQVQTKLLFGAIPYRKDEMMSINVDTEDLKKIGWQSKISLDEGLNKIIKEE